MGSQEISSYSTLNKEFIPLAQGQFRGTETATEKSSSATSKDETSISPHSLDNSVPSQAHLDQKVQKAIVGVQKNPVLALLEEKTKADVIKLEKTSQNLKQAQKERDAILKWKPKITQQKGERVSKLTLKNLSVAKEEIHRKLDQEKVKKSKIKLEKAKKIYKAPSRTILF